MYDCECYVLPLIFIVQSTIFFMVYNEFPKILPSTSMHFTTRVRTWRVARLILERDQAKNVGDGVYKQILEC